MTRLTASAGPRPGLRRLREALRSTAGRLTDGRRRSRRRRGTLEERTGLSLARYAAFLPQGRRRRVAILVPAGVGAELRPLLAEFAGDDLYVVGPAESPEWGLDEGRAVFRASETIGHLHFVLKLLGPVEVIVDLWSASKPEPKDLWTTLFFHLRPRGVYVLANQRVLPGDRSDEAALSGATTGAAQLLSREWTGSADQLTRIEQELLASCARFLLDRSYVLVEKRQTHYLKLRDSDVGRFLPSRNTDDTVRILDTLPKGELTHRGKVVSHEAAVEIGGLPETVPYPELHVHHYEGRIGLGVNSLLYGDSTILPGSFRYPLNPTLDNPRITSVGPDFARIPASLRPTRELAGSFYHLDAWNPGHFGHVITEVVSRLWGWDRAKAEIPDLKAVFRRRYPNERFPALELSLFTAYGIERDDIVWLDEPVWLSSVVTATPMWQNDLPYFVHPAIETTWQRLRTLAGPLDGRPRRIFVSRRPTLHNRACRNVAAVEEIFVRHGFTVVFPEELDFAEQATVFGAAEVVAGFAGSGLYNVCYSGRLQTLIVLSHEGYTARYEHLYSLVLGCDTHYFWSTPDVPHPVGGWSEQAYYSAWEFDLERNGAELDEVLAGTG